MNRLLADQCMDAALVRVLRERGHDVVFIQEIAPGLADAAVLALSRSDQRILITFDKGFGELALTGPDSALGVILLRDEPIRPDALEQCAQQVEACLAAAIGAFTTIQSGRIRRRPLP